MANRSRGPRPDPSRARPQRLPLYVAAGLFMLLALVAAWTAIVAGSFAYLLNAIIPALVAALFIAIARRQEIHLDRQGVAVKGFGATARQVRWRDVDRLELTDAGRFRLGPRMILRSGRAVPMPAGWRLEDDTRLPEAALAWSRWARVDVVGERTSGRRWPVIAMVAVGGLVGVLMSLAGV